MGQLHMSPLIGAVVQPAELKILFWMHNAPFVHVEPKVAEQNGDGVSSGLLGEKLSTALKQNRLKGREGRFDTCGGRQPFRCDPHDPTRGDCNG